MPAKRSCILTGIVLQLIAGLAVPTKSFAQPPWCPDLTNDNFVNFDDFAIQANNWLLSGESLDGDFYNNGLVNIYDFDYLAAWWLHGCFGAPPPDICPDCNYPDCNLIDCNVPPDINCEYCQTTPPYLIVTITGHRGCGCSHFVDPYTPGSSYVEESSNVNGTFILPYYGNCEWRGSYHDNIYSSGCPDDRDCSSCMPPIWRDPIRISVLRGYGIIGPGGQQGEFLDLAIGEDSEPFFYNIFYGFITNMINCSEGTIANGIECGYEPPCPPPGACMTPDWGDGSASISLPMQGESFNTLSENDSLIKSMTSNGRNRNSVKNQKELLQLRKIAISWLIDNE